MLDGALLRQVAVFGGLTEDQLALVFHLLDERDYAPGATVVEEGTSGRELFVIVEGRADSSSPRRTTLAGVRSDHAVA